MYETPPGRLRRGAAASLAESGVMPAREGAPAASIVSAKARMRGESGRARSSVNAPAALAGSGWQDVGRILIIRINLSGSEKGMFFGNLAGTGPPRHAFPGRP